MRPPSILWRNGSLNVTHKTVIKLVADLQARLGTPRLSSSPPTAMSWSPRT